MSSAFLLLAGLAIATVGASGCVRAPTRPAPASFPGTTWEPARVTPRANAPEDRGAAATDGVVRAAMALRGTPYRFGGATPESGFDCSGLVAYVLAGQSIAVPRSVAGQFAAGAPVAWDRLQRGDLVFFSTLGPGATHVGIVTDVERAEFVHAPADGASVRTDRFDTPYWRSRYVGARRLI